MPEAWSIRLFSQANPRAPDRGTYLPSYVGWRTQSKHLATSRSKTTFGTESAEDGPSGTT